MAQNWYNNDGLFLQYGTDKAIPETAGEFVNYGSNRVLEVLIDLTTLTSTAAIQSNTTFFPDGTNIFIEQVDVVVETASVGGTSFSVGLIQTDRATIPANYSTAFVNALVQASTAAVGDKVSLTTSVASAGGLIGSSPSATTGPYYITALAAGTYSAGKVRVRISYHGIGTISS